MTTTKANKKLSLTVAAYLTHKGVANTVDASLTFEQLDAVQEACDPLALESVEARACAYARLAVLKAAAKGSKPAIRHAVDALTEKAKSLINPVAVRGYALKRGKGYREYVAHKIAHPRGKSAEELAEAYMKLGEIEIAIKGYAGERAEQVRMDALNKAKLCLLAAR